MSGVDEAAQLDKAAHVAGKVLSPDLGLLGPDHPDRSHQGAARVAGVRADWH